MNTSREKILNYLLFFLLSLTGLASLLLVKNNYLYIFMLTFLIFYWQRLRIKQVSASFPRFLVFGMVGVLLFQLSSGSARFYQRPILTLIVSLVFYLPYFFLWYKLFLKRRVSLSGAFFFSGLLGVLVFGLLSGKLTTTLLTAPTLASGLLYTLLKAAGILSVVGALTVSPFLFFHERETTPLVREEETKNNSGFGLIGILVGVGLFLIALTLVGAARYRQDLAQQKLAQMEKDRREEVAEEVEQRRTETPKADKDQVKKVEKGGEQPRPQRSVPSSQESKDFFPYDDDVASYNACQANPSIPGCEVYYYDPYSDPNSPEYQAQLQEQWYASQQDPAALFFTDPVQLWSQDPFLYEMFQGIYGFDPIPGFPW